MRGNDHQQSDMHTCLSPGQKIRAMAGEPLKNVSDQLDGTYAKTGNPSLNTL
jgi:hypothetical protein